MSSTTTPPRNPISVTVFTGFLGAGKTTVILSLLPQLPKDYKVVLLKNEFGDIEVDSKLAQQSSLAAVSEILNGCMCCILVGQMKTAMLEIRDKYRPDRIIIESSGSAFPATLAFQIRELERETQGDFKLDAIVTVVDAENFTGYEDTSPTAKMQASYTDIILINKSEHVSERQLDLVMDHLATLNDYTPKIRCRERNGVDPQLIFGLETKLFSKEDTFVPGNHNDEVETATVYRGSAISLHCHHTHGPPCSHVHPYQSSCHVGQGDDSLVQNRLVSALDGLAKEVIWRVKGFVRVEKEGSRQMYILNWAFGRYDLTKFDAMEDMNGVVVKLTIMGERGEVKRAARKFRELVGAELM